MSVQFEWYGEEVARLIEEISADESAKVAAKVLEYSQVQCPVKTGRLRASHRMEPGRTETEWIVSASTPYAAIIHAKNPWMDRAVNMVIADAQHVLSAGDVG